MTNMTNMTNMIYISNMIYMIKRPKLAPDCFGCSGYSWH